MQLIQEAVGVVLDKLLDPVDLPLPPAAASAAPAISRDPEGGLKHGNDLLDRVHLVLDTKFRVLISNLLRAESIDEMQSDDAVPAGLRDPSALHASFPLGKSLN